MKLQIDSLVRGRIGATERIGEGRVYSIARTGYAFVIDAEGEQKVIYQPEVIAAPRPVRERTDIPARLR